MVMKTPAICKDKSGNFGMLAAIMMPLLLVTAGGAVDFGQIMLHRQNLQEVLDGAVLSAVTKTSASSQLDEAKSFFSDVVKDYEEPFNINSALTVVQNDDGSLSGTFTDSFSTTFLGIIGMKNIPVTVRSTAIMDKAADTGPAGCIYTLASKGQDFLVNSGANVKSSRCQINIHSTANPAFIMNSGSSIETAKFCVKGTRYIKNGGTITNMETGCSPPADPWAGKIAEPQVPSTCTTSGARDGTKHTLKPGVHCYVNFNGTPTVIFEPGLHIIKGAMNIGSGATVIAEGVTFYFPDTDSYLRANGGVTFTGKAPESGPYKGILMFEKESGANYTSQYVFNGSKGETLEGVIHLPNREVVYNSTSNQTNRMTLVASSMIINSANWQIEPFEGGGASSSSAATAVRLVK